MYYEPIILEVGLQNSCSTNPLIEEALSIYA
jgi:hypothetical protein